MSEHELALPDDPIVRRVALFRGRTVMLDADLAMLYGVRTKALLQAVRRNRSRFPSDFAFQLTAEEAANLRSQTVTSSLKGHGGRRYRPYAFTEQGVAMLASVLRSPRAIRINIEIVRAFVRLRHLLATNAELARRLVALESRCDAAFHDISETLEALASGPTSDPHRERIGFRAPPRRKRATPAT
jgi:phage regulator Rha-like protein